ncbi:transglutaminase-like cysteine peptidase [Methylobacterium sp. J-072]|uniref:transglutaminase-like cysteine peptidase n=1 Tax=Methylobacterium sp. J-072 TaxID=2836651 RepID=UPI001FB8D9B5|nr:transglutaminase-like cysteine peptidase [Methylobacterium sp. J-072]MCJ2092510.1 transglutaminase-like cysteine peptidase [Methylobacterium sp. J-072]
MRFAASKVQGSVAGAAPRRVSRRRRVLAGLAWAALCFAGLGTGAVQAQTFASLPSLQVGAEPQGAARPIAAWVTFCQSYAAECTVDRSEPARISLTPATWATIVSVNRRVNKSVEPQTDMEHLHVADRWDLAEDGIGDCEDFQLLKRHLLAEAGLPRRAMRMTVVIDEKGEGHAVLTLITDRGDMVLDNKTNAIVPWHKTGYVFIKRESQDATAWVSLGGVTSPVTTANR